MSGIIFLAAIWVFASARSWPPAVATFAERVADLADWAGLAATLSAVMFTAFVTGTALRTLTQPVITLLRHRGVASYLRKVVSAYGDEDGVTDDDLSKLMKVRTREAKFEIGRVEIMRRHATSEQQERLDRLDHEAEARAAMVLPLVCLTISAASAVSPWCMLGLLIVTSIAWQAHERTRDWVDSVVTWESLVPAIEAARRDLRHLATHPGRLSEDGRAVLIGPHQVVDAPAISAP